jgi:hypothetical protein
LNNNNKKLYNKDGNLDEGILIAIVDTFSSYAIMYLNKQEDYKKFLSLKINMINYDENNNNENNNNNNNNKNNIDNNKNKISMTVKIEKKFGRNILLNISVYDSNNKEIKKIFHLKRKINTKL